MNPPPPPPLPPVAHMLPRPSHVPPVAHVPLPPPPPPVIQPPPPPPVAQVPLQPPPPPPLPPSPSAMRQFQDRVESRIDQSYKPTPEQQAEITKTIVHLQGAINMHIAQLRQSIGELIETPIKGLLEKNVLLRAGNIAHHDLIKFHQRIMDAAISKRDDAICDLRVKLERTQQDLVGVSGDLCQKDHDLQQVQQSVVRLGKALQTCEEQLENAYVRLERKDGQLENTSDALRICNIKLEDALEAIRQGDDVTSKLRAELNEKCEENARLQEQLSIVPPTDSHLPWLNHERSPTDETPAKRTCLEYMWFTIDGQTGSLGTHVIAEDLVQVLILSPLDAPLPATLEDAERYVSARDFVYGVPMECAIVFHFFHKDPDHAYSKIPSGVAWENMLAKYPGLAAIKDRVPVHVCNNNAHTINIPQNKSMRFKPRKGFFDSMESAVDEFNKGFCI